MTCYDEPMPHLAAVAGFMPVLALAPQDGPCNCGDAQTMPPTRTLTDKISARADRTTRQSLRPKYRATHAALLRNLTFLENE